MTRNEKDLRKSQPRVSGSRTDWSQDERRLPSSTPHPASLRPPYTNSRQVSADATVSLRPYKEEIPMKTKAISPLKKYSPSSHHKSEMTNVKSNPRGLKARVPFPQYIMSTSGLSVKGVLKKKSII